MIPLLKGFYPYTCILPEGSDRVLERPSTATPAAPKEQTAPVSAAAAGASALPPLTTGGCSGWGTHMPFMTGMSRVFAQGH